MNTSSHFSSRRGVAMLLVIISMMTATILTTAYLASRDNSALIGDNVADSAAARWAAESGLEMGAALLETEVDWRTMHDNGKLLDDLAVSGGSVDLDVVDLLTGTPPTTLTEHVQLTAIATVDGVQQTSVATAWVPAPTTSGADIDLSEFAVFATEQITLSGDATVMRWPRAPLTSLGMPISVGTQATSSGSISLSNDAAIIDGQVYTGPTPSSSLVTISNDGHVAVKSLLDSIPMPRPPVTGVSDPPATSTEPVMNLAGGASTQIADARVSAATISSNAVRTIQGNVTLVSDTSMTMTSGAKILVDGNARIVVFGDFSMDRSAIELKPGATLKLYVGEGISLSDSYIGDVRSTSDRDNTGMASPMDPERIAVYRVPSRTSSADWRLQGNSVVKGSLYAKSTRFEIRETSALYGRVAATEVRIVDQGALFYDHQLDSRSGYTVPTSSLFNEDATLRDAFKSITSLDASSLQALADLVGINLKSPSDRNLLYWSATAPDDTPVATGPSDPTPRPVDIEWQLTSHGSPVTAWETADPGAGVKTVPTTLDTVAVVDGG